MFVFGIGIEESVFGTGIEESVFGIVFGIGIKIIRRICVRNWYRRICVLNWYRRICVWNWYRRILGDHVWWTARYNPSTNQGQPVERTVGNVKQNMSDPARQSCKENISELEHICSLLD